MQLGRSLRWALPLSVLSSLGTAALATTIELSVLPTTANEGNCPASLIAHETSQPYFEGGFARDGMIKLGEVATNIRVLESDVFRATWVGTLKPEYRSCEGSAIINSIDAVTYEGHSYLAVHFINGQARATLDMTGIPDANGFTSSLIFNGLRQGNPRWTWGGTD